MDAMTTLDKEPVNNHESTLDIGNEEQEPNTNFRNSSLNIDPSPYSGK